MGCAGLSFSPIHSIFPERNRKPGAAGSRPWRRNALHHLAFHAGRILTYGILGTLAAGISRTVDPGGSFHSLRGGVTYAAGIVMILMGLILLKVLPFPPFRTRRSSEGRNSLWNRLLPPLLQSSSLPSGMALGLAAGFLPCGLSWAMVAAAAATADPLKGFLTMTAFGLGTIPALLSVGVSSSFLSVKVRLAGERVAALSVIAMGLFMLYRGAATLV